MALPIPREEPVTIATRSWSGRVRDWLVCGIVTGLVSVAIGCVFAIDISSVCDLGLLYD